MDDTAELIREVEEWKPFVRNRVATIQEMMPMVQWHYVRTADNPADVVSRGCDLETFKGLDYWTNGPRFLLKFPNCAESSELSMLGDDEQEDLEKDQRKEVVVCSVQVDRQDWLGNLAIKFSNFQKNCRVLAWVIRFSRTCRDRRVAAMELSTEEIEYAEALLIRHAQRNHFGPQLKSLSRSEPIPPPLAQLSPFLDRNGVLRVRGRLAKAPIPYDQKHPMILPHNAEISRLIILHYHHLALHGGAQVTLNMLRRRFWILRGLQRVKSILFQCVKCFRAKPRNTPPMMGSLPEPRVTLSKPFLISGVDFAGPIRVRISSGRGTRTSKAYIAVFVCLAVKAFHLEVVSSLTTDAFLGALTRFKSRRGTLERLYSDNGTFRCISAVGEGGCEIAGNRPGMAFYSTPRPSLWRVVGGRCQVG